MDVQMLDDVGRFADKAREFFRLEPFTANVIATNVAALCSGQRPVPAGAVWVVVEDQGEVRGIAMHTPPFSLFLPRLGPGFAEAVAHRLADAGIRLPGVNGECASVEHFASVWLDRTGQSSVRRTAMRMYVLDELRPPGGVVGNARRAGASDATLVARWVAAFHEEAMPGSPVDDWQAWAERRIAHGDIWLWHDGDQPVSMAGVGAHAGGVSRVGPVYTPPGRRRRGYGAAVTAAASHAAIARGARHVVLYTDLANPVSNAIYQDIGYVSDHDAEERDFV